uniref:Uncharacterized protein n=1 Tax=Romanomermis culicivorax TaxID=13658 RepID=A0A915HQA0_ROMCU
MAAYNWSLFHGGTVIMEGYRLCGAGVNADGQFTNHVDIRLCEKIRADDTLIVSVIAEDYTLDHMFTECGFHFNNYWAMGVDNGPVGHFDFTTYQKLERLLVKWAFD